MEAVIQPELLRVGAAIRPEPDQLDPVIRRGLLWVGAIIQPELHRVGAAILAEPLQVAAVIRPGLLWVGVVMW